MNQVAVRDERTLAIEQKINQQVSSAISVGTGGITFQNAGEVMEYAKMMAVSGSAVPKHLRGQPGACLGIIDDAIRFRTSPYALARKSYFVNDNLAYEAQVIAGVINAFAPLKQRPDIAWEGEGLERVCIVTAEFKDSAVREVRSPKLKDIHPKNSPLWKSDPDQQQSYYTLRSFARRWCPEIILGIYDVEEMRFVEMRTVSAEQPSVMQRLQAARQEQAAEAPQEREGFDPSFVTSETAALTGEPETEHTETSDLSTDAGTPRACAIDGCKGKISAKGYCSAHYNRMARHGDPLLGRSTMAGEPARFFDEVVLPCEDDECLLWPYARDSNGRGTIRIEGRTVSVHRAACATAHGEPPTADHEAAHSCGNGHLGCVNPKHLRWATKIENEADKINHGTSTHGEQNGNAKLTIADVAQIRVLLDSGRTQQSIADEFSVSRSTVKGIAIGQSWSTPPAPSIAKNGGSDAGSGIATGSSVGDPAATDTAPTGDEGEAGQSEAGDGPEASSVSPELSDEQRAKLAMLEECADRMLDAATHQAAAERVDRLDKARMAWLSELPNDKEFVQKAYDVCARLIENPTGRDQVLPFLKGQARKWMGVA